MDPSTFISHQGGKATFTCCKTANVSLQWIVNRRPLNDLNFEVTKVMVKFSAFDGFKTIGSLSFINLTLDLNMTKIKCRAICQGGLVNSTEAELLIQGERLPVYTFCPYNKSPAL